MISLSKALGAMQNFKKPIVANNPISKASSKLEEKCDLNLLPTSYVVPSNLFQKAKAALEEFKNEFGEIKSSTYICEKIKQAKNANDDAMVEKLSILR